MPAGGRRDLTRRFKELKTRLCAVVFCACDVTQLHFVVFYVIRAVQKKKKFDFTIVTNERKNYAVVYFGMGLDFYQNLTSTNTKGKGSYSVPLGSYKLSPIRLLSDKKRLQDNIVKSSNYMF
jgi:hypothetical protein